MARVITAEKASHIQEAVLEFIRDNGELPWDNKIVRSFMTSSYRSTYRYDEFTIFGSSGEPYSGGNAMLTAMAIMKNHWTCRSFFTFKKVEELGGRVNKGEHAVWISKPVTIYLDSRLPKGEQAVSYKEWLKVPEEYQKKVQSTREWMVFNGEQTNLDWQKIQDGYYEANRRAIEREEKKLEKKDREKREKWMESHRQRPSAQSIIDSYTAGCPVHHVDKHDRSGGCYYPSMDYIEVYPIEMYESVVYYYATVFHEMIHATGHESRLNRKFGGKYTDEYAREEMVAEFGSMLLIGETDLGNEAVPRSASYIKGWNDHIKSDKDFAKNLMVAVGQAVKGANYILSNGTMNNEIGATA